MRTLLMCLAAACLAADFPRWRGANSNGSAGEPGMALAKSWDDVRVAWVSEAKSPHSWTFSVVRGRTQWPRTVLGNGGYCLPAVAGGKVYVSIWRPSGNALATDGDGKYKVMWAKSGIPSLQLIGADQVIICMDAATGRTLWEAVWPDTEMNHVEMYGGHNNLCVANGRVYAIGGTGRIYCADAKTGEKKWMSIIGPSAARWDAFKVACIQRKLKADDPLDLPPEKCEPHPQGGSLHVTTYNVCPVVADGVVVTGEWSAGSGLVGFDAETGKELWRLDKVNVGLVPPLRWVHDGKEYLLLAGGGLTCLEPKTGQTVWNGAALGNVSYGAASPAIEGDYFVAHGAKPKGGKSEGWVGYRLSATGAEKVWALGDEYPCGSYIAPVIHRGIAWFNTEAGSSETGGEFTMVVGVEVATGKVLGKVERVPMNSVCPGPVAMGDLLAYQGGEYVWLIDISDPKTPKFFGKMPMPVNLCSSLTAADGFVYVRGAERLVTCLDVRAQKRSAPGVIALTLPGATRDGTDAQLFLRGTGDSFPQSWAVPVGKAYPDVVEPVGLKLDGATLTGKLKCLIGSAPHEYVVRATLQGGRLAGEFEDVYVGLPVKGGASGTMVAVAGQNCTIGLSWPRHWINGQNQGHEHGMDVTVANGKVTAVTFKPRLANSGGFKGETESFDLQFDGQKLSGTVVVKVTTDHVARSGRYTVALDCALANNNLTGQVKSTMDSRPTTSHPAFGAANVPESEPVKPDHALFNLDLPENVLTGNDTGVKYSTRVFITTQAGKPVDGIANVRANAGMQRVDVSGLRLEGNRLVGKLKLWVIADGYGLRNNSYNVYDLDVAIDGQKLAGTYDGFYDAREPRKGQLTGTYSSEKETRL